MSGSWKHQLLGKRWPGPFKTSFHPLLAQLTELDGIVLQILHSTRGSRIARAPGTHLTELVPDFDRAGLERYQVAASIERLRALELIQKDQEDRWKTTWTGSGVSNWRTQLSFSEEVDGTVQEVAEPREGENGDQPLAGCTEYRPAHFSPAYCWCRRIQHQHVDQVLLAADRLLRRAEASEVDRARFPDRNEL